ncbi:hypothetical protein [Sporosarcina sp. FSL K6-5500]|uniref:hypothetical protein n=1 Tax=Sporosarcina sp. FSL K6-5500 TaxID=2921558 RepID=UPI0030FAF147
MSKTMITLIAGILVAWLVISLFAKNFDGNFLITLLIGVFVGYGVRKKETKE